MDKGKKVLLICGIILFLLGAWQSQKTVDKERKKIEQPNAADLQNAPPMLRFTTIALGGFRGIYRKYTLDSRL
jgi:cytochrome oxidase assembly protein ShyY1